MKCNICENQADQLHEYVSGLSRCSPCSDRLFVANRLQEEAKHAELLAKAPYSITMYFSPESTPIYCAYECSFIAKTQKEFLENAIFSLVDQDGGELEVSNWKEIPEHVKEDCLTILRNRKLEIDQL